MHVDELTTECFSPKCRANSSITYPGLMNVNLEILQTVKSTHSHIEIFLQSDDGIYDLEIMNRTVDMCRFFRDLSYEPILQVGLKLYKSSSNFLTSCFMKKVILSQIFNYANCFTNTFIFMLGRVHFKRSKIKC